MTTGQNVTQPNIKIPFLDENGLVDPVWYRFLETLRARTGGDIDSIEELDAAKVNKDIQIETQAPLRGGGPLESDLSLSIPVDPDWTAGTGELNKGPHSVFVAPTGLTDADLQSVADAVQAESQRLRAIEAALINIGLLTETET